MNNNKGDVRVQGSTRAYADGNDVSTALLCPGCRVKGKEMIYVESFDTISFLIDLQC